MVATRLTIDSIAAGGDGIGRADGLAVFVPRTAPGDVIEASLDVRGRFARGRLQTIVESSRDRVDPVCRHYTRDRCGGCQLQHLAYGAQLGAKSAIVRDSMQRIAKRADVREVDVVPSPSQWAYRTKLTLALRWTGERWRAGLHPFDNPDDVFQLEECPITDDRVLSVWRDIFAASTLRPRVRRLRGAVRLTDDGASFVLEGGTAWPNAVAFADRVGSLTSIWWQPDEGQKRLVVDRRTPRHVAGATAPDASFAQVNAATADQLRQHILGRTMATSPATVVDAYAGAGATAVGLAEKGVSVTAIELDAAAARWTAAHLPAGSRAIVGRVEDELPSTLPADVVILNPPRTGVDERVTESLAANPPRVVVYVSCNPATLARDVGRLPQFRIASILSFDMFPQTAHVETVCELVREAA
jgi:23S rRNA (uracil1939-C5)-methyltransferase